jgi:GT2 family glycosyltransferase
MSVDLVRTEFPVVRLLVHKLNRGFAEAVATGVESARNGIVILLNTDVTPDRDFIAPLVSWFCADDLFAVSPLIYAVGAAEPHKLSVNRVRVRGDKLEWQNWTRHETEQAQRAGTPLCSLFASGGSMAFRRSMFLELGGFLDLYKPFYGEDRDLGVRAWRRGWRTVVEPRSRVTHQKSGTIRRTYSRDFVKQIQQRNAYLFVWLHFSVRRLVFCALPATLVRVLGELLRFDVRHLRAFAMAVRQTPEVARLRRLLNAESINTFEEVLLRVNTTAGAVTAMSDAE